MFCRSCSYVLNGLGENTCPECGTAFDKNDPKTWKPAARSTGDLARGLILLLVFWHLITIVEAGHGIAVVGMLYGNVFSLSYSDGDWSLPLVLVGCAGLVCAVVVVFLRSSPGRRAAVCASLLLLAIAEAYFLQVSEAGWLTYVSSLPFWGVALFSAWRLAFGWPRK